MLALYCFKYIFNVIFKQKYLDYKKIMIITYSLQCNIDYIFVVNK